MLSLDTSTRSIQHGSAVASMYNAYRKGLLLLCTCHKSVQKIHKCSKCQKASTDRCFGGAGISACTEVLLRYYGE